MQGAIAERRKGARKNNSLARDYRDAVAERRRERRAYQITSTVNASRYRGTAQKLPAGTCQTDGGCNSS